MIVIVSFKIQFGEVRNYLNYKHVSFRHCFLIQMICYMLSKKTEKYELEFIFFHRNLKIVNIIKKV